MPFTETMTVTSQDPDRLRTLLADWHTEQLEVAPGYQGVRLLEDQGHPGRWIIEVDFTSYEDAERTSGPPRSRAWAEELRGLLDVEPEYQDDDLTERTERG
ncbi:MAG: hypothetical protein ACLFUG_06230 [Nitriliruptoraceae bacterium]